MKLTKPQLTLLKFYAKYETKPLTLFSIVRSFWILWLLLLVFVAAGRWYMWAGWPTVGWLLIGVSIGAFLRDVKRICSLFCTWPVIHEIINWKRVRELIQCREKDA